MPSFSSSSPPVATRVIDDTRSSPTAPASLITSPSTHKTSPVPVSAKSTPAAKVDSALLPAAERAENNPPNDSIDRNVFEQVLELDDEDDDEEEKFSKGMVEAYYVQADKAFNDMDGALEKKDLRTLSDLGHFLKGSSAALGVYKVQSLCEQIQHYGQLQENTVPISEAEAVVKITKALARARKEYADAKIWLKWFFDEGR